MDRFIAYRVYADGKWYNDLKSNMDRFIAAAFICKYFNKGKFKIQYG